MSEDSSSSSVVTKRKRTFARRPITIKKIENKNSLYVTFSKRRGGLFRKAGTLNALTGAEVAVLVFSPNDKPYVYGYPSVDSVISRLESMNIPAHGQQRVSMHASSDDDEATQGRIAQSSSAECGTAYQPNAGTKSRFLGLGCRRGLKSMSEDTEEEEDEDEEAAGRECGEFWWDQPIEKMTLDEVKQFRSSLEKLRTKVAMHMDEMTVRKLAERVFLV